MSAHEKTAWWALVSGLLIWCFLLMRFTEDWRVADITPGFAVATYVQMIVLWIIASTVPALLAAKRPADLARDERDDAIEALGDRWEGWVVIIAINALVVQLLTDALFVDRVSSVPKLDLGSTNAIVFALLTVLFLADAVKRAVILWQYRR
jgi:hypothetical protein